MHLLIELDQRDYRYHGQCDSNRENGGMKRGLFPTAFCSLSHLFIREPFLDFARDGRRLNQLGERAIK